MTGATLEVLVDPPLPGADNMARDEALLHAVGRGDALPRLRFYAWSAPTLSLGYFQPFDEVGRQPEPIASLPVVRRTTGGGAILHDLEVTYALVVPIGHPWLRPNANRLYELAHRAIIGAVGPPARMAGREGLPGACDQRGSVSISRTHRAGPFFCFDRRHTYDVVVPCEHESGATSKLAGSAQRRTRTAVLQHGSLMLDSRFPQQSCATWRSLGGPGAFAPAVEHLRASFERELGMATTVGSWSAILLDAAAALIAKYAGSEWTLGSSGTGVSP